MKFYLAGPVVIKDTLTKLQMNDLEKTIERMRLPAINPGECDMREDRVELYRPGKHKVPNAWGIDMQTWAQCVFTMDVMAIDQCDWMVVADYGREGTAGTAWEAGYAFAKGVKILVVQMPGVEEFSLMTQGCAANICKFEDFISGVDCPETNWRAWDEIYDHKFEKYFFERGRKAQKCVLN